MNPSNEMLKSIVFYSENFDRVNKVLETLADDKSRDVFRSIIEYRCFREPIPSDCYSLGDQYFVPDIIEVEDDEVFVDGGAFIGDTIQHFINSCNRKKCYKKIVAFEPDSENYKVLLKFFNYNQRLTLIEAGLSNKSGKERFFANGVDGHICDETVGGGL